MAESQTKDKAPSKETTDEEPTFTVAQLLAESRSTLGVASHVAAGAFHGLAEGHRFTRNDAKERIEKFQKRKAS
jgi:hypothetical protein